MADDKTKKDDENKKSEENKKAEEEVKQPEYIVARHRVIDAVTEALKADKVALFELDNADKEKSFKEVLKNHLNIKPASGLALDKEDVPTIVEAVKEALKTEKGKDDTRVLGEAQGFAVLAGQLTGKLQTRAKDEKDAKKYVYSNLSKEQKESLVASVATSLKANYENLKDVEESKISDEINSQATKAEKSKSGGKFVFNTDNRLVTSAGGLLFLGVAWNRAKALFSGKEQTQEQIDNDEPAESKGWFSKIANGVLAIATAAVAVSLAKDAYSKDKFGTSGRAGVDAIGKWTGLIKSEGNNKGGVAPAK